MVYHLYQLQNHKTIFSKMSILSFLKSKFEKLSLKIFVQRQKLHAGGHFWAWFLHFILIKFSKVTKFLNSPGPLLDKMKMHAYEVKKLYLSKYQKMLLIFKLAPEKIFDFSFNENFLGLLWSSAGGCKLNRTVQERPWRI